MGGLEATTTDGDQEASALAGGDGAGGLLDSESGVTGLVEFWESAILVVRWGFLGILQQIYHFSSFEQSLLLFLCFLGKWDDR